MHVWCLPATRVSVVILSLDLGLRSDLLLNTLSLGVRLKFATFTLGLQHRYSGTPKIRTKLGETGRIGSFFGSEETRRDFGLGKGLATDQASSSGVGLGGLRMLVMRN